MRRSHSRFLAILLLVMFLFSGCGAGANGKENAETFRTKEAALRSAMLGDSMREGLAENPAGEAGYAVFFSICSGAERADVYSATGNSLDEAWDAAAEVTEDALKKGGPEPFWVKADLVYMSEVLPTDWLENIGTVFGNGNFRYGLALEPNYETALLEGELNSAGIYDYENGGVDLERLNAYLKETGRETVSSLPEEYTVFQCAGCLCDENGNILQLGMEEHGYGHREITVDDQTALALALDGAEYLAKQVQEDGSILSADGDTLSVAERAEVLSALLRGYQLMPGEEIGGAIDNTASGIIAEAISSGADVAFLPDHGEITLENNALALIALADCAEISKNEAYLPACKALGAGILSLLDTETGTFAHVLDAETLSRKEEQRSPAWDAMAVTALCRLYGLTEDTLWLWSAKQAMDHMVAEDYTQYGNVWCSYAAREITKYEQDEPEYFVFALKNAQRNLSEIYGAQTASPEGLELLMVSYECYRRMTDIGYSSGGFELALMQQVIQARAQIQLDGYIFPETAMYMESPQEALGAFMSREEGLRIIPEKVCHSILGYYMYAENYDDIVAADDLSQTDNTQ